MSIYTRTGDKGETRLFGGSKIDKDSLRVDCYGTIDESNSIIGLAYSVISNEDIKKELKNIQKRLFVLGAQLASDDNGREKLDDRISQSDVDYLESIIDKYEALVGRQTSFIIPGENTSSSALHVARTVVRRTERLVIALSRETNIDEVLTRYLNRLSDVLFIMARAEERYLFIQEVKEKVLEKLGHSSNELILNLAVAKKIAEAAEKKGKEIGVPIVVSILDQGGNLILLHRMEDSLLASIDISMNKAYTALALKMPTNEVANIVKEDSALYGIQWTNKGRIVPFGGGYPLEIAGKVIGALGVSGGTVEEDTEVSLYALKTFEMEGDNGIWN